MRVIVPSFATLSFLAAVWLGSGATQTNAQANDVPPAAAISSDVVAATISSDVVAATPTVDRLAAPPTVASPTQADRGAQIYWLNCQPCHGDRGQGLTDEWRAQYPPEDQNCWDAGCHGRSPYENGFKLPGSVPAVIGPGALDRFTTAADLHVFISRTMPFQAPGSLSEDEYGALTAFLLRGQGRGDPAQPLGSEAAARLIVLNTPAPTPVASRPATGVDGGWFVIGLAGGLALAGAGLLVAWRLRRARA